PCLMSPAVVGLMFHWRSPVSVFTGADGPSVCSHLLKSRFMPYLRITEQSASLPFASLTPEHVFHNRKFFCGSLSTMLGMSAGSTMTAPCCLSTATASAIALACASFKPPRPSAASGRPELVEGLVVGRASLAPGGIVLS